MCEKSIKPTWPRCWIFNKTYCIAPHHSSSSIPKPHHPSETTFTDMARLTLAALLVLAVSVQGTFTIPKGTPDGVYGVSYDTDGNAIHFNKRDGTNFTTAKPGLEPSDIQNKHSFSKRADGPKCVENGAVLARNDITQAQYALADACDASGDEFIPDHGNRYSKFGAAVVYVCNYGVKSQHCYSSELNSDLSEVEALCGDVAGRDSMFLVIDQSVLTSDRLLQSLQLLEEDVWH
jgi:hypothetical protein